MFSSKYFAETFSTTPPDLNNNFFSNFFGVFNSLKFALKKLQNKNFCSSNKNNQLVIVHSTSFTRKFTCWRLMTNFNLLLKLISRDCFVSEIGQIKNFRSFVVSSHSTRRVFFEESRRAIFFLFSPVDRFELNFWITKPNADRWI